MITQTINNNTNGDTNSNNNNAQELSVKTYRFFGYAKNNGPDMYTTLKLYSDGTYRFYLITCSSIRKFKGNYKETTTKISLTGDKNMEFTKTDNGKILEFDFEKLGACNYSGGSFGLESYILES